MKTVDTLFYTSIWILEKSVWNINKNDEKLAGRNERQAKLY